MLHSLAKFNMGWSGTKRPAYEHEISTLGVGFWRLQYAARFWPCNNWYKLIPVYGQTGCAGSSARDQLTCVTYAPGARGQACIFSTRPAASPPPPKNPKPPTTRFENTFCGSQRWTLENTVTPYAPAFASISNRLGALPADYAILLPIGLLVCSRLYRDYRYNYILHLCSGMLGLAHGLAACCRTFLAAAAAQIRTAN